MSKKMKELKYWPQARLEPATSRMRSECPIHWTMLTCASLGSLTVYIHARSSIKATNSCSVKMLVSLY